MFEEILKAIGLSSNEAKVYEAMLKLGESSVQAISLRSGVHRRNVYDSLAKLQEKSLTHESFVKGEKFFKPVDPERLLEILREKEEAVGKFLPDMKGMFESVEPDVDAYLYKGIEGFKNYFQDILKTKENVYFIGAKAIWLDPRLEHFLPHFQRERKKLGIKFYHIFDHEVKKEKPEILKFVGGKYKFLPAKYSSSTMVDIFGDYVTTFTSVKVGKLPEEPLTFVMKSRVLADGYRRFWQFMWDFCDN
jgi:sugar-specific transcriptional regulator TrmB